MGLGFRVWALGFGDPYTCNGHGLLTREYSKEPTKLEKDGPYVHCSGSRPKANIDSSLCAAPIGA